MRKQTRILIIILIFTMFMALSASMTRVWLDEATPKTAPLFAIYKPRFVTSKSAEANRNLIRLRTPAVGSLVSSPLRLTGSARGYWFFEGVAPIVLYDAEGNEISTGHVSSIGKWMTEDFVSFEGVMNFALPETAFGTLVLKNANVSGEPGHDIQLKIPVRFR